MQIAKHEGPPKGVSLTAITRYDAESLWVPFTPISSTFFLVLLHSKAARGLPLQAASVRFPLRSKGMS